MISYVQILMQVKIYLLWLWFVLFIKIYGYDYGLLKTLITASSDGDLVIDYNKHTGSSCLCRGWLVGFCRARDTIPLLLIAAT